MTSNSSRTPLRARAASSASTSVIAPSADCTTDTATRSWSPAWAASSGSGTSVTRTPRWACTANGRVTEENSPRATSTRVPSGTDAASGPIRPEVVAPCATSATGTPVIAANPARAASTSSSKSFGEAAPTAQRATTSATTADARSGGMPMLAVFR